MSDTVVLDEAIRVVVAPSQASYFAGEPFSVTITITNTRTSDPLPPRSYSATHKRAAHSISSVPLARPPTSPGIRAAVPAVYTAPSKTGNGTPTRKGLVGRGRSSNGVDGSSSNGETYKTKSFLTKSLSVSIAPHELRTLSQEDPKGKSPVRSLLSQESTSASPTSPRISSPLARSATVPTNHPHARKHSVLDGQLQLQDLRPPPSLSPFSPTPSASTSAFSLSLDPIAESAISPVVPPTPSFPASPIPEAPQDDVRTQIPPAPAPTSVPPASKPNQSHFYPPRPPGLTSQPRRPPQLGLGRGPPPASTSHSHLQPPRTAFSSSFPNSNAELILYSYAQLVGTLSIVPLPGTALSHEQTRTLNSLRSSLLKRQVMGGGSMDIAMNRQSPSYGQLSSSAHRRGSHSRSSSLSSGLLSLLSPSSQVTSPPPASQSWTPSHRARTPSVFSGLFSSAPGPGAIVGLGIGEEETIDPETPLPTIEMQPTMLAVDLSLGPGESRSYTYTIVLPENLPPTFRGRSLRFSYQFTLGICRAASGLPAGPNGSSRVMKVPIRVYNNVAVGRPPTPYDLLWPVVARQSRSSQPSAKVVEGRGSMPSISPTNHPPNSAGSCNAEGTYEDLQAYAIRLLSSLPDTNTVKVPDSHEAEAEVVSCREAVEILSRNPKKLSYDVNKDGVKVAVLTFTKSAYRLGETVLGVVELNELTSRARVLKLSVLLEAHESLPPCISPASSTRHMRRVHAEHHSSFMPSTLRTTFSLDIPSDASPAFQVDVSGQGGPSGLGGLEWKVRLCLLVSVASPIAREGPNGSRLKHLVRDGPRGEWGSSWKAGSSIAPMERPDRRLPPPAEPQSPPSTAKSWASFFTSTLLGASEIGYHDGDEDIDEGDEEEGEVEGMEDEWREVKAEMVECEVPIKVWPGNTAFKAMEVAFEL